MIPVALLTLPSFIPAALTPDLTKGADMMFCPGQGLRPGPRAGTIGRPMTESRRHTLWLLRTSAVIFTGLAVRLALLVRA